MSEKNIFSPKPINSEGYRQAKSLIVHEIDYGTRARLWTLFSYDEGDDEWFRDRLIGTFKGVDSIKDVLLQVKLGAIIGIAKEKVLSNGAMLDDKQWAAKLHGAYIISDALAKIMPAQEDRERRLAVLAKEPLRKGVTPLEELMLVDVVAMSQEDNDCKIAFFAELLEDIEASIITR